MPDRDKAVRRDETWKLDREPRLDIQVLSQDRRVKNHVLRRESFETRLMSRDSTTDGM